MNRSAPAAPTARPYRSLEGVAPAPAFATFLAARLAEEIAATRARCTDTAPAEAARRGLRLLEELAAALGAGETVDRMSLDLLVVAYAGHADFRPSWNRWRVQEA